MSLFACPIYDKCVSLNDKFRIDVSGSWFTPDVQGFTLIEIEPETGVGFFNTTNEQFLDWQYDTIGTKTFSVRLTDDLGNVETFTFEIEVKEDECFLANDDCLKVFEPEIMKYLPCERCSWNFVHRKVRDCIVDCLTRMGVTNDAVCKPLDVKNPTAGQEFSKIDPCNLVGSDQIEKWATFWALELIHQGISNTPDDVFATKANYYASMRMKAQSTGSIFFDRDGDGKIELNEQINWFKRICN